MFEDALVPGPRRRLKLRLRGKPRGRPLAHREPASLGIDVRAGLDGGGNRVEPMLSVDLTAEVAGVFLAGRVTIPRAPLTVRAPSDASHSPSSSLPARGDRLAHTASRDALCAV